MNSGLFQLLRPCALGCLLAAGAWAGPEARAAQPINLDTALAEEALAQAGADGAPADGAPADGAPADLALSYYHYVLAQWYDNNGDPRRALDAMKQALGHNPQSSAVHLETALLLGKTGNLGEAIAYAEKAVRLDPENPEPRWLLANIYLRPSERSPAGREWLLKAAAELEALKLLTPGDERVHYLLGSLYFQLNEPEKAIAAYEQYQRLPGIGGLGYRAIAKHYEETGEPEKALEYLNRALEAEPESPEALMQLGSLYSRIGENRKAAEAFQALLELTGHNPEVTRSLAESLFNDGDYAETIRLLEDLGEKTPLDRESRLLLGRARLESGARADAIPTFRALLDAVPGDTEARFYLGRALAETGSYEEAVRHFSDLVRASEGNEQESANRTLFRQNLAALYIELGEHDKAIELYRKMAGEDPRARIQLLNAYRTARRFDEALQLGRRLLDEDPDNVQAGILHALTLGEAGKSAEAVEALNRMLESHPENLDIVVNLSQLHLQSRRFDEAERVLVRAESRNPEADERLKFQRAAVYERGKDYDRAESLFKELLDRNPENAMVLNYLGYMLADRGVRLEEAVGYVRKALAIEPNNGAYLDSLGWAFFKLDDLEQAEKYLLEAKRMVQNDPTIDEHLGDLYHRTGDLDKARDFYRSSVRIGTDPEEVEKVRRKLEKLERTRSRGKSGR
ncbi:MAG: tetratricopeptide repeat protein [Acidobacteria bacterium]|nr:tetratricopeptide repeat protein [Acidobacteriota bacterium]